MEIDAGQGVSNFQAFEQDDADGWLAGVALAVKAVLLNGDGDIAEALEIKLALGDGPDSADPVIAISRGAIEFWRATGGGAEASRMRAAARRRDLRDQLPATAELFASKFRLNANPTYKNAMIKRVVRGLYIVTSGIRPVFDLIDAEHVTSYDDTQWQLIQDELVRLLGRGNVDVDRLGEKLFRQAYKEFAKVNEEEIVGDFLIAIRVELRTLLEHALQLRDAIAARNQALEENPAANQLLSSLRSALPQLRALAESTPEDGISYPVLVDLVHCVAALVETS